jgi:hypothetical protein
VTVAHDTQPGRRTGRRHWNGWAEIVVLLVADQTFEWVRSKIVGSARTATRNARFLVRLERDTWLYHELRLQRLLINHRVLVMAMDIYYGIIHFAGPPVVLFWLWRRFPERYARWRNALVIATLLGLLTFAFYPVAPPRLLPLGFVDTMRTVGGLGPLDAGNFKDTNAYAAMPSLHLTWSTWCAFAMATTLPRRWQRIAVFLYPALTLVVVMATANHFFLDAVGGWVGLSLGWWLSGLLARWRKRSPLGRRGSSGPDDSVRGAGGR